MSEVKKRRRRKPMTPEQKAAAAERLKKARAAKAPAKNTSLHESIRNLDEDHHLHPDKVKEWIKEWKNRLSSIRHQRNSKTAKEVAEYYSVQGYIQNMQNYLSSGCWNDMYYGINRNHKIYARCVAPAYDKNGNQKFSLGTYYPEYAGVYIGNGQFEVLENADN